MGNASKALVIAGGILISVLIISVCMYMYTSFKSAYEDNMRIHESIQIEAFNSFFYNFSGQITGLDAYNIVGKIKEINSNDDAMTNIFLSGVINESNYKTETFYFTESFKNVYTYSCKDTNGDGLVDWVSIN